jgi:hypothetical protein
MQKPKVSRQNMEPAFDSLRRKTNDHFLQELCINLMSLAKVQSDILDRISKVEKKIF